MKKINFRSLSEILNEKELKNVTGGSGLNVECFAVCVGQCMKDSKWGTCYSAFGKCSCILD